MEKPLRKDAAERRALLLQAARQVFAEFGINAPLDLVAERAGLGRATLYRNFADRTALALAVLTDEIDELHRRVEAGPQDGRSFSFFFDELIAMSIRNAALSGMLRGVFPPEALQQIRAKIIAAGTAPLRRAQADGLIREDIEPADLRFVATMLGGAIQGASEAEAHAVAARARELLLNGLGRRP